MPTAPDFIERNGETILAETKAEFEALLGRTIYPAQAEHLILNGIVARELLILEKIQRAMEQMLLDFSAAPALDYLAALIGVTRLPASGATCTVEFTLVDGHGGVIIPSGTRIGTVDGRVVFVTQDDTTVLAGINSAEVTCIAENLGTVGNGYASGDVSVILDPYAFISAAENIAATAGGADAESDDELRSRTKLAPAQFSVAGPKEAYAFFAKSASSAIIDVAVAQIVPGTVGVYPLVAGGTTPSEILELVESALNDERIRPLTDTVVVESPTIVAYDIEVDVTTLEDVDVDLIQAEIEAALQAYADEKAAACGGDIVIAQIIQRCMVAGVYNVDVTDPAADEIVDFNEVAIVGTITVNMTDQNEG